MEEKKNNLWLYEKYKTPPKEALKDFNNGSFKGTEINAMWRIRCLTEEFGPCGFGWYYDIIRIWTEQGVNNEIMCFAEIKLYVKYDNEWSKGISATGGSKLVEWYSSKKYNSNTDEGYKMALTDALGVACKFLGFGASVYWENEKSKHTQNNDNNPNKPLNTPKTNDNAKADKEYEKKQESVFKPISRVEMVKQYGIKNVEETISWFEDKLQVPYAEWDEECDAIVRAKLLQKKKAREKAEQEEMQRRKALEGLDGVPFALGDEQ